MPVINISLEVTQEMIDAGGVEIFAKSFGWTEKIKNENGEVIDNPVSALEFGKSRVRDFVRERVKVEMAKLAQLEAKKAVIENFKNLDPTS